MRIKWIVTLWVVLIIGIKAYAQIKPVKDTNDQGWNYSRLINVPTTKILDPKTMDVFFMHRLGNLGSASAGGFQTLYGFDVASDIVIGFDFGISKRLTIGVSRSKDQELVDAHGKYLALCQKNGGSPVSLAVYEDDGIIPQANTTFYASSDPAVPQSISDRFVYLTQVIISRKFSNKLSLELVPTLSYRNHILIAVNYNNNSYDENAIPAIGVGGRLMVSKRLAVVADYYYIISKYRVNNPYQNYYNALSVGIEVKTGGHVFEINFSNAIGSNPNNFIPYCTDTWTMGGFKFGFTLSRIFDL